MSKISSDVFEETAQQAGVGARRAAGGHSLVDGTVSAGYGTFLLSVHPCPTSQSPDWFGPNIVVVAGQPSQRESAQ